MRLKTTTLKALLVALLALLSSGQASGASTGNNIWISIRPEGGDVRSLAIDPQAPNTVYAGTYAGVLAIARYSLYLPIIQH